MTLGGFTMRPRAIATVLCIALFASLAIAGASHAQARPTGTAAGQILVVTANLDEVFEPQDVAHHHDMQVFARRVATTVPAAPDVLLLQEVGRPASHAVAHILSRSLGHKYVAVVAPGAIAWTQRGNKLITTDTAILLNTSTMERLGHGGFITNSYPMGATAHGMPNDKKKVAYVAAKRRSTNTSYAIASLHFVPNSFLTSMSTSSSYKRRWATQVTHFLRGRFPKASPLVGGDFNSPRCLNESSANCQAAPFWSALTNRPLSLDDTLYAYGQKIGMGQVPAKPGVDFIFTRQATLAAGSDYKYTKELQNKASTYYSDHQFHWALIGPSH
jgi:hypothetical protein